MLKKLLAFDLWGRMAHFSIPYTKSSRVTYPIPPKTAVAGMIGAVLGMEREQYLREVMDGLDYSVSVLKPIREWMTTINLIGYKDSKYQHTQVPFQFIVEPRYRIYVTHKNDAILKELGERLEKREVAYHLYLGTTDCIGTASLHEVREVLPVKPSSKAVTVSSFVPAEETSASVVIRSQARITLVSMPDYMDTGRRTERRRKYYVNKDGTGIPVTVGREGVFYTVNGSIIYMGCDLSS